MSKERILIAACAVGYEVAVFKRFFAPFQSFKNHEYEFLLIVQPGFEDTDSHRWLQSNVKCTVNTRVLEFKKKHDIDALRYFTILSYLHERKGQEALPDYTFCTDFRDVLFINDLVIPQKKFMGVFQEDMTLAESSVVQMWLGKGYSEGEMPPGYKQLPLFCSGNLFGDSSSLFDFLTLYCEEMEKAAKVSGEGYYWGITMASLFYLVHTKCAGNIFYVTNSEGDYLTASARGSWKVSLKGELLSVNRNAEFCFVHMIDRFKFSETIRLALRYDTSLLQFLKDKLARRLKFKAG